MAVCKILQKEDVDMFTFDFTRTMGEETSTNDLFQVVEELKNGHVVSVLYGNAMASDMPEFGDKVATPFTNNIWKHHKVMSNGGTDFGK